MARDKVKQYERQDLHRKENHKKLWDFLLKSSCLDCGIKDARVLEFDHMRDKKFNVSRAVSGSTRSWNTILKEIEKCQIVCANCHRIRTQERGKYNRHKSYAIADIA
jgi:hypothetical protein